MSYRSYNNQDTTWEATGRIAKVAAAELAKREVSTDAMMKTRPTRLRFMTFANFSCWSTGITTPVSTPSTRRNFQAIIKYFSTGRDVLA
ncbi:MAG: hypothetical protein GY877_09170 [Hyphomicrobium sp.]|nr:hypothetical protein [Hyphomicrobium sp.]